MNSDKEPNHKLLRTLEQRQRRTAHLEKCEKLCIQLAEAVDSAVILENSKFNYELLELTSYIGKYSGR